MNGHGDSEFKPLGVTAMDTEDNLDCIDTTIVEKSYVRLLESEQ